MSAVKTQKKLTCCFSGHRILPKDFDVQELEKAVYNAINDGFSIFLTGMALGFDSVCFKVLEKIRKENDIKIKACVPCRDQERFFTVKNKREYYEMLSSADEVVILADEYFEGCMQARNEYMVDNSERLICFLRSNHGGTYSTIKYAVSKGLEIVYIGK